MSLFVLQLCPVVDIVVNLVNIHLMSTLNGGCLLEGEVLWPHFQPGPRAGAAPCGAVTEPGIPASSLRELLAPRPSLCFFYTSPSASAFL